MTKSLSAYLGLTLLASVLGTMPTAADAQPSFLGFPPHGFEPRDKCGDLKIQKETVRIKISQAALRNRKVHKVRDDKIEENEDRTQKPLAQPDLTNSSLPLNYIASPDVDMSADAATRLSQPGDWAYLKISLGENMKFVDKYTILVQDLGLSTICEMEDPTQYVDNIGNRKNWFVRAKVKYTPQPVIMLYNVGVLVIGTSGTETPIFVDPKIKNTG